jgi:membrane-associated protease RseP (regulator of RpoE activity)
LSFPAEPVFDPPLPVRHREPTRRYVLYAGLFLATAATTTAAGIFWYLGYAAPDVNSIRSLVPYGLYYSVPVLTILGCHEFGHYFACRYYGIDASLPYFIPLPWPFLSSGTLGAVIRIRQRITHKQALFDIGIAGPIAGFIALIPFLWIGMHWSRVVPMPPPGPDVVNFGEPLLLKFAAWTQFGRVGSDFTLNLHPMAWAAWFGMLATSINLFPIAQLDGGHISYAVLGRPSGRVTLAAIAGLAGLCFYSWSWLPWTVITVAMISFIGYQHPPVWDEDAPLDPTRKALAVLAVVMFALCFMPAIVIQ